MENTVPADREVPDACTPASAHVCRDASAGDGKASPEPAESVRPGGTGRQLGKTPLMTVRGGEVVAAAACAVVKHPLRISPSRDWFILYVLCQVGPVSSFGTAIPWWCFDHGDILLLCSRTRMANRPKVTSVISAPHLRLWRAVCLKYLLNQRYTSEFIDRLRTSPRPRDLCGFTNSVPSEATFNCDSSIYPLV